MSGGRMAGLGLLAAVGLVAGAGPLVAPHDPVRQFAGFEHAPPMPLRIVDRHGRLTRPFAYPLVLVDRLERRYAEDRSRPAPIRWFDGGAVATIHPDAGPWLPLGADPVGRDVFSRLVHGSRVSLGVALLGSLAALALGVAVGGPAGFVGGRTDSVLMTVADFVLTLPAVYVVLAFRAALPLVLTPAEVFWSLTMVLALAGWPIAARGVRGITAAERHKAYAEAAYAMGGSPVRILLRHLLPASVPFLLVTGTLLLPAFILAEATLSLAGLGFPVPTATWGAMLRDGWESGALADAPWLLSPAALIVTTVLALHLLIRAPLDRPGTFL